MKLVIVVIGRNEGERLRRCLHSLIGPDRQIVYVDSGSCDGSIEFAKSLDVDVVELDTTRPFTAARARNAGWRRGLELSPDAQAVQFVDGDCEVTPEWLPAATAYLNSHSDCSAVCGHLRERFPKASVYNRLCELEWDGPPGFVDACGGNVCMRCSALESTGGFRDSMIAGEEPELCFRIRSTGGQIVRLDAEMATHDAAMTTFRQWWRRAVRAGHAFAEGDSLTNKDQHGLWRREVRSIWFWAAILPITAIALAWPTHGWSLVLLAGYFVLASRIALRFRRRVGGRDAICYAISCVVAKFAHLLGMLRYHANCLLKRDSQLLEHKPLPAPVAGGTP